MSLFLDPQPEGPTMVAPKTDNSEGSLHPQPGVDDEPIPPEMTLEDLMVRGPRDPGPPRSGQPQGIPPLPTPPVEIGFGKDRGKVTGQQIAPEPTCPERGAEYASPDPPAAVDTSPEDEEALDEQLSSEGDYEELDAEGGAPHSPEAEVTEGIELGNDVTEDTDELAAASDLTADENGPDHGDPVFRTMSAPAWTRSRI